MAFLLPPEEIVYYHYQLQQDRAERATITVGVTADSAVTPTVIVVIVTVIVVTVIVVIVTVIVVIVTVIVVAVIVVIVTVIVVIVTVIVVAVVLQYFLCIDSHVSHYSFLTVITQSYIKI